MSKNRIYMDWEFLEDGSSITPISVGLVADRLPVQVYARLRDALADARHVRRVHDFLIDLEQRRTGTA